MAASNGKVTLAVLGSKLDTLTATVNRIDSTVNGDDDKPGLKGRVDRLEQTEERRKWHIRTLWASAIAFLFKEIFR